MKKQIVSLSLLLLAGSPFSLKAIDTTSRPIAAKYCPLSEELRTIKRAEKWKAITIINSMEPYLQHEDEKIREAAEKTIKRANHVLSLLDWGLFDHTKTEDQKKQEISKKANKARKAEEKVYQLLNQYQLQNSIAERK